jgi:hypothetical protein
MPIELPMNAEIDLIKISNYCTTKLESLSTNPSIFSSSSDVDFHGCSESSQPVFRSNLRATFFYLKEDSIDLLKNIAHGHSILFRSKQIV